MGANHQRPAFDLVRSDLSSVTFLGGIDGHTLLLGGLVISALGLLFGLVVFVQLRNLPVHAAMREVRRALSAVPGISDVNIEVVEPKAPPAPKGTQPAAPTHAPLASGPEQLGHILAISSGKGGVGKSTVAANLAAELARKGRRVGVMDADVYGPNIPRMFGVNEKPPVKGNKIVPLERYGVKLISLGFLVDRDAPAIWRGPIVTKIIQQFLRDVDWGPLDYFIVDLPPGTGDAQLDPPPAVVARLRQVAGERWAERVVRLDRELAEHRRRQDLIAKRAQCGDVSLPVSPIPAARG